MKPDLQSGARFFAFYGDAFGDIVSQADGLPIHTGEGSVAIKAVVESLGKEFVESAVFIPDEPI